MNGLQTCFSAFRALPLTRQWLFSGGFVLVLTLIAGACFWWLANDLVTLFEAQTPEDAREVAAKLESAHIPFSVQENGRIIKVERTIAGKTRLQLLGAGLSMAQNPGFELFDKSDFGITDYTQKINYQRALQGELERTIASLEEVAGVRVHLVVPEGRLFEQNSASRQAAVTLKLRKPLTREQIAGIRTLIAASVASLPAKNVVLLDQRGTPLIPGAQNGALEQHWQARRTLEHYLREKILKLLQPVFPDAPFAVQVDANLNFDAFTRERTTPENRQLLEARKQEQTTPGKAGKPPTRLSSSEENRYQSGSRTEHFTRARGRLQRLNVSIALPDATTTAELAQIQRMVRAAVGIDTERGDSLSVEAIIHVQKPVQRQPMAPSPEPTPSSHTQSLPWILLAFVLIAATVTHHHRRYRLRATRETLLLELNEWLTHHES